MPYSSKVSIFLLRVSLGWLLFYAGITKVLDPQWSAAGFLSNTKTLPNVYQWFGNSSNIGWVNFANEWGLTLIGAALILGVMVRWAALVGGLLMLLYYLPILDFPFVGQNSFIVDQHLIFIFALIVLASYRAGHFWGLDKFISKK